MKTDWKAFLIENGAEFEAGKLISFGNPSRERRIPPQGNILCDLSHINVMSAYGEDTATFLQNQFTNDIRNISTGQSQLSAWCNPKGRAIASFRVFQRFGVYYITLSGDLLPIVLKRLRMYVFRSKVILDDATDNLVHFGYAGPQADKNLVKVLGKIPQNVNDVLTKNKLTIIRVPGTIPRFEILGELTPAKKLWQRLHPNAAVVNSESWRYLAILAGLPTITKANTEAWIPQMLNFDLINGLSFNKGCFPGQEIVARLKYLGTVKRRLYRIEIQTDQLPNIGDKIFPTQNNNTTRRATEAGKILNAVFNPDGKIEALAVLKTNQVNTTLHLNNAPVKLHSLPYKFT